MKNIILIFLYTFIYLNISAQEPKTLEYFTVNDYYELKSQCDSLQYYKNEALKWKSNYESINPYSQDGYDIKIEYSDSLGFEYHFTKKDGKAWLKIIHDDKRINFWQFGNEIQFWYSFDTDSISNSYMINNYNIDWFKQ